MDADELKKRTKLFALRVLKLAVALPGTIELLVEAGSKAEFIAKVGIVEEEADESAFWLELIIEGAFLKENRVKPLLNEANELTKIMASSRVSASRKVRANRPLAIGNRQ